MTEQTANTLCPSFTTSPTGSEGPLRPQTRVDRHPRHRLVRQFVRARAAGRGVRNAKEDFFRLLPRLTNGILPTTPSGGSFPPDQPGLWGLLYLGSPVAAHLDTATTSPSTAKASRGKRRQDAGLGCSHTVTVWAVEHGLCFAQQAVDSNPTRSPPSPRYRVEPDRGSSCGVLMPLAVRRRDRRRSACRQSRLCSVAEEEPSNATTMS